MNRYRAFAQPAGRDLLPWLFFAAAILALGASAVIAPLTALAGGLLLALGLLAVRRLSVSLVTAVIVALLALPLNVEGPFGAEFSPQNVGTAILVFLAFDQLWQRRPYLPRIRLSLLIALYAAIHLLAIGRGPTLTQGPADLWILYRLALIGPLAYFAFSILFAAPNRMRKSLQLLALASALSALLGIIQSASGAWHLPGQERIAFAPGVAIYRAPGTFEHPNALGIFLSTTVFLSWSLYASANTQRQRRLWLTVTALQAGGIVASFSRTAWVAGAAGLSVLVLFALRRSLARPSTLRRLWLTLPVVVAIVAFLRMPALTDRLQSIANPGQVGEFRWRMTIWRYALGEIANHPWLGKGTAVITAAEVGFTDQLESFSSHNLFVSLAYEGGLILVLLYMAVLLVYWLIGVRLQLKRRLLTMEKSFVTALLASMTAFQVSGIGSASMNYASLSILFWMLVAMLFVSDNREREARCRMRLSDKDRVST